MTANDGRTTIDNTSADAGVSFRHFSFRGDGLAWWWRGGWLTIIAWRVTNRSFQYLGQQALLWAGGVGQMAISEETLFLPARRPPRKYHEQRTAFCQCCVYYHLAAAGGNKARIVDCLGKVCALMRWEKISSSGLIIISPCKQNKRLFSLHYIDPQGYC